MLPSRFKYQTLLKLSDIFMYFLTWKLRRWWNVTPKHVVCIYYFIKGIWNMLYQMVLISWYTKEHCLWFVHRFLKVIMPLKLICMKPNQYFVTFADVSFRYVIPRNFCCKKMVMWREMNMSQNRNLYHLVTKSYTHLQHRGMIKYDKMLCWCVNNN
jgi:hypothetical protein